MDRSGNGIDTDARDDTESAGYMALPLSSTAFGDYSHSDRDEDEKDYDDDDDDDDNDDEAGFSEDEDLDESFFVSSDEFEWPEPIYARAIVTTPEKEKMVATCHAKLIRRRRIIDNFYDEREEPTEWTWEVSPFPPISADALFRPA
jgi:hypothetical protein